MKQREVWIDVVKGIGIIAVVYGHVFSSYVGRLWHMPLFFMLAGYHYHLTETWPYIKKLTRRLLIPYVVILFGILLVQSLMSGSFGSPSFVEALKDALYGGAKLQGMFAIFWFVTVLYCMLICLHLLSKAGLHWWMVCVLLAIGYLPMYFKIEWPWNLQVVPMALAYGCTGCLLKKTIDTYQGKIKWYWLLAGLAMAAVLSRIPALSLDMKYNVFGIPGVSFLASVFCVLVVFALAKFSEPFRWFSAPFSWFGRGSMVIMYVHVMFLTVIMNVVDNLWVQFILVIALSMAVFLLVEGMKRWIGHAKSRES